MAKYINAILGSVALAGLVLMVAAYRAKQSGIEYPIPFGLLCSGAACSLIAGIPWAHMRGWKGLKSAFLGLVGFGCGGALGLFVGDAMGPKDPERLGTSIGMLIGGFWLGGLLFGSVGIWWGIRFHRRFDH